MTAAIDFVEDYAVDFWRYDVACGWHPPVEGADARTILEFLPTHPYGEKQTIWTTATTVDDALDALGVDLAGAELSASRSSGIGRQGLAIIIATQKPVVIIDAGKKRTITTTGQTLADALAAAKITVDNDDKLSADPNTRLLDGAKFPFTRVDIRSKTKKVKVDYGTDPQEVEQPEQGCHQGRHTRGSAASVR